jgi:shikimate kinase
LGGLKIEMRKDGQDMTNIILTGFMGSGKTTVGKLLAHRLQFTFVDTDDVIEDRAGMPISDIFATQGEFVFRQMEAEVSQDLARQDELVVSTGGGLMLNQENAKVLGENGRIFCLIASPDDILQRVLKDGATRPLLADENPRARIEAILRERADVYAQFEQISTSGKTPQQVANEIMVQLGNHQP